MTSPTVAHQILTPTEQRLGPIVRTLEGMGNIGKERRRIEVLPVTEPSAPAEPARPAPAPSQPQRTPEPEPTR